MAERRRSESLADQIQSIRDQVVSDPEGGINSIIKGIGETKDTFAREIGLPEKYSDELRNVLEQYARDSYKESRVAKAKNPFSKFGEWFKGTYGYGDAIIALLLGLLPSLSIIGLMELLKREISDKEEGKQSSEFTKIASYLSVITPIFIPMIWGLIKLCRGRSMRHSPLLPFLTGYIISFFLVLGFGNARLKSIWNNMTEGSKTWVKIITGVYFLVFGITLFTCFM